MAASPRFLAAGDSALVVEFGDRADPALLDEVLALDAAIAAAPIEGVVEVVPTYRSLMIHFDPACLSPDDVQRAVSRLPTSRSDPGPARCWRIPVCYDPPYSEDLDEVAAALALAPERIVQMHAEARYRVVMYGFAPGFVFLSGLPEELTISRRATPRAPAPPGSLTIANGQALIASVAMPTGWYMLGRTPARTFDPDREPSFPIAVGDEIVFERIDARMFDDMQADGSGDVLAGSA